MIHQSQRLVILLVLSAMPCLAALVPVGLRCENRDCPLGIDVAKPGLSWKLESQHPGPARGIQQSAYQVLVASSEDILDTNHGDLWDSGKVVSSQAAHVEYAGLPLRSRQQCFWKVKLWVEKTEDGRRIPVSVDWSKTAMWTMGLLTPDQWSAKWIAAENPGCVDATVKILRADYGDGTTNGTMDVTEKLAGMVTKTGLAVEVSNTTFGRDPIFQKVKRLHLEYELNGKAGVMDVAENKRLAIPEKPIACLRKSFDAGKNIKSATVYASALGLYELRINGRRVGDHVIAPDWTDYNKRVRYQTYDVTALLKKGKNAMGAFIANGWYAGHIGNGGYRAYGKDPALLVQLEIHYKDGTVDRIVTDESWRITNSPLLSTDFMLGENYNALDEIADWDMPGIDDGTWMAAAVRNETRNLESQVMEPVRKILELKAKSVAEPMPGKWTFDLGQNMVGVVRLKVAAKAGTKLTIRHAEMLNPDNTIYTANLRGAPSVDTYVCKGVGVEVWQPKFTFHGFRYVEVTGLPKKPGLDAVTGIVLASDNRRTSRFDCSDPRINQLYSNIIWGQMGNYLSIPTDCPQRDERLGWMGDAQVFVRTATYNADVAAFFDKWLVDVDDAQTPDGAFSDVSPECRVSHGVPGWGDAGVICPWTIYQAYGDKRVLERHLPAMKKWVEWCKVHSTDLIRDKDRGNDYGDWLSIGANTPKDLIGTAYFAYSSDLLAKSCRELGRIEDALKYEKLFNDIKAAFVKRYVKPDGRIHGDTQSCYAMALKFHLLTDDLEAKAIQYLEADIKARGNKLSTGFIGTSYLLPVLSRMGRMDTAFNLFIQDGFPSWLFTIKHGATTIWERWDGWTPEHGFQDPGMNSFNHYAFGACGEWMFSTMAGIDSDTPGFSHIIINPHIGGGITRVNASYDSICGLIVSSWKVDGSRFTHDISIPPNTTATVHLPAKNAASVTESGKPADQAGGVKFLRMENGKALYEIGSGHYAFASTLPPP